MDAAMMVSPYQPHFPTSQLRQWRETPYGSVQDYEQVLALLHIEYGHAEHGEDGVRRDHPGYWVRPCKVCREPTIVSRTGEPALTCGRWACVVTAGETLGGNTY